MKILIHALGANMGGAMRHLTNFLPELGAYDKSSEYVVLVRESFPEIKLTGNIRLERVPDGDSSSWLKRIISDVFKLPRRLKREDFSAVISLTNFGPIWSPVPHVFFQRNALYYCPYYLNKIFGRLKIETLLRRWLAIFSMMKADLVVTPSNAMGEMIRQNCPQTINCKFHTLYHGFDSDGSSEPLDQKFLQLLSSKKGKRLLFPTHVGIHKGFDVLFSILANLKKSGLEFCLFTTISRKDWPEGIDAFERTVKELGLTDFVVFMGSVPQRQMGSLYYQCDLMVYPSLSESFGFSMIEAMGYGLPIVASGTAVNREMCGNAALYYSPLDPIIGARIVEEALKPDMLQHLSNEGRKRLSSIDWSWKRYAKEFVNMVEDVVGR